MGLQVVPRGYKGLQGVTKGNTGLERLQGLQKVTRGYKRIQGVTRGYRR